jgi:exodeoxyribonuclease VII large subunit
LAGEYDKLFEDLELISPVERKVYSVSELTDRIRYLLETELQYVWIEGEISNFRPAPSGHWYFTLKDEASQIRCAMFRNQNRYVKFRPEDGLRIVAWGKVSVYSARGEYQLILETMEPQGLGSMMLAFEQLKSRLAAEGLFDQSRKKPLPRFPRTVGLVTSPKGAALRDMIRIIQRRFSGMAILISPTLVQGDKAPEEITAALERLIKADVVDVIIVGRGGGSIEDLWAFNDERVVRAVATCPLPIVSAVGHETDTTLTDYAADLRASTPSAAAELVAPTKTDLCDSIRDFSARLRNAEINNLQRLTESVKDLCRRLYDPRRSFVDRRILVDDLMVRLERASKRALTLRKAQIMELFERLRPEYLTRAVESSQKDILELRERLIRGAASMIRDHRIRVENLGVRLNNVSPLAVLSRGYSITQKSVDGSILTDAMSVNDGDDVQVRLKRGLLFCRVLGRSVNSDDGLV